MFNKFDNFITRIILEKELPTAPKKPEEETPSPETADSPDNSDTPAMPGAEDDLSGDLGDMGEFGGEEKPVFPEELELAKLAIRALYFNVDSKDVHNLKLRVGDTTIPFEKISDYFEKTKKIIPILGFVEWVMDKYEGLASKWTEDPEVKGKSIKDKLKYFKTLPEEEQLDNGRRSYWVRIILNCLLQGTPNSNIDIADVNEKNIIEVFRLLKQHFGHDTRGLQPSSDSINAPGVF